MAMKQGKLLVLKFGLDQKVSETIANLFVALLVEEMEFGPLNEETQRREKDGWGIGTSLVTKIESGEADWKEPRSDIRVRFEFAGTINEAKAETFWQLVQKECAHSAWGIGPARVLAVGMVGLAE